MEFIENNQTKVPENSNERKPFCFFENTNNELFITFRREFNNDVIDTGNSLLFEEAVRQSLFDKNELLIARQKFYFNKPVTVYNSMTDIKSITVAVPTYNGEPTIFEALNSIVQNLKEISDTISKEIIICTDHCTDSTLTVVNNFIQQINNKEIKINVIENNNTKGKTNSLNSIFLLSVGQLICVVDDDVILEKSCLLNLMKAIVEEKEIRCVFSARKRLPLKHKNPWRLFCYWILGSKFDVTPYDKPSGIVRGQCMMLRRENFIHFPKLLLHEDQFLHYIFWPLTKEITNSLVYFRYVSSISDYYRRSMRLKLAGKQMHKYVAQIRINEYKNTVVRKINYQKVFKMSWKLILPFFLFKVISFFIDVCVKLRLNYYIDYKWSRVKQW